MTKEEEKDYTKKEIEHLKMMNSVYREKTRDLNSELSDIKYHLRQILNFVSEEE